MRELNPDRHIPALEELRKVADRRRGEELSWSDPRVTAQKDDIRAALRKLQDRRCVYCERILNQEDDVTLEHIKPRSEYPQLTFSSENLALSCCTSGAVNPANRTCDAAKANQRLPESCEPQPGVNTLFSLGTTGELRAEHDEGDLAAQASTTLAILNLNSPGLVRQRKEIVETIASMAGHECRGQDIARCLPFELAENHFRVFLGLAAIGAVPSS